MTVIRKTYKFYAAHRNQLLGGKCSRIHGHRYELTVHVTGEVQQHTQVSVLFEDIDTVVEPIVKEHDHWFLIHKLDPILPVLQANDIECKVMPCATSAENLSEYFYNRITETGLTVDCIELRETDSAVVVYKPE